MNDSRRFEVREDLLIEQIEEEVMILDMERNVYFGLDPMARVIWSMLSRASSVEEIIELLHDRYGEREQITEDVTRFVEQLLDQGLMQEIAP